MTPNFVHATALVVDGFGILIRGESGAGKSLLALALLHGQPDRRLVSDDRVAVSRDGHHIRMRGIAGFEGQIELRGRGLVMRPFVPEARLHLVVDLVTDLPRLPPDAAFRTDVLGVDLPRAPVPGGIGASVSHQVLLVEEALGALRPQTSC